MQKGLAATFLFVTTSLLAFDEKPWFSQPYEVRFNFAFGFQWFDKVQGGEPSLRKTFYNRYERAELGVSPIDVWDIGVELETADTTKRPFYFRSGAVQVRRKWLNDVTGDPASVVTGIVARGVPSKSLTDISTPYSGTLNGELYVAAGRELAIKQEIWRARIWGVFALGFANRGDPWTRVFLRVDGNISNKHELSLYFGGYFGFGAHNTVLIDHFRGWGNIHHRSIDVGASYRFKLGVFGQLSLDYIRTVSAHAYLQNANSLIVSYFLPFSPF